ncbi:zf-DHHC-domain-containing protein [Bimuria novae-zelandiae CBS 107.79]|uniref:Palmitoyltransferase PFA4 n=1 Tax=Bimuria novae-zelandiae CBS 107.79 TaxID=1447943 RepID=A0A6A5VQY4_9PLEO|nr:zf-DHHC-domain-containing protein [Bimuria novae-zelandiae CBS 107.79]
MVLSSINQIAVPGVYLLIFFLGYPSQILFYYIDPAPLTKTELYISNGALVLIFITYTKSVFVDPGTIPKSYGREDEKEQGVVAEKRGDGLKRTKWCRKCNAVKPPRAHHCKECKRCIPKMDHHCPWTTNCVSHTTFPHFIRFLCYTSSGLTWLEYLLWIRISYLWENRNMPAYLGPNPFLVAHLFVTTIINSITLFALGVLFIRNVWCLAVNTTTIEGWEIERHKTLLRRARHFGGTLTGPDGSKVPIKKQEFPYDIGIWENIKQGMGTGNPLSWFNPFASTPSMETGLSFPTNGFEDASLSWPPPDPDRSYRRLPPPPTNSAAFTYAESTLSPQESMAAFRERQVADAVRRRKPFVQRLEAQLAQDREGLGAGYGSDDGFNDGETSGDEELEHETKIADGEGEEAWRNSEGERLKDFGVDEEIEFYDEQEDDDMPLSELLARRRAASNTIPTT